MRTMMKMSSRKEWLAKRASYIGGSDAASIIGLNPWRNNVELWEIKTGRKQAEDISKNPVVEYGTKAENPLREIFKLDFPQYEVFYTPNNIWFNEAFPWAHASLDGWIMDDRGRMGVLEIKTSNINSKAAGEKWRDRIPDNYYIQLLHCMAVIEADFAILTAQLKYQHGDDVMHVTKHYTIERADVEEDIAFLMDAERDFAKILKGDTPPALILPEI